MLPNAIGSGMNAALMNRVLAYCVMAMASLLGGGALLAFYAFLIAGSFALVRFDLSETQILLVDAVLSMLFFVQHSGMVRQSFRAWLAQTVPRTYHPAVYAIASGLALVTLVVLWQASPTTLFEIHGPLRWLLRAFSLLAIAGFLWGMLALGGFDAFGRQPIASRLRGRPLKPPSFVVRGPYRWVRHPLYFFSLLLIWASPDLSSDRLLFNVLWTSWIVLGSCLEERDLLAEFGERYRGYQKTVPMLLPWRGEAGRTL